MKKTFIFGLIAAALGFTACSSEDDLNVNDNNQKKGMVLRATVEQAVGTRATFTDNEGVWQFAFAVGDNVSVSNIDMFPDFYTFTNEGTEFKCEGAKAEEGPVTWYAYFPSNEIDLTNQSGTKADVANKYALAGATTSATTGEEGLNITMSPKVAILVIDNQKGTIDINVKNGASTWVKGLTANADGFNVTTSTTKQNLLSVTTKGTYYIAVPAGIQLAVKYGDKVIKSTGTSGLTAGKYYNLTIATTGTAKATIGENNVDVKWIQLWEGGPKFAEYNYGAEKAENYGKYINGTNAQTKKYFGDNWRLPTTEEYEALIANCTYEWITVSDVAGLKVIGKDEYSSNSIFLPAAGYSANSGAKQVGVEGYYWTTSSQSTNYYCITFSNLPLDVQIIDDPGTRKQSVRYVLAE
ncbi:MAG: hypothetical protein KBS99_08060 [Prevotellaceae bacterium]|nr:hypothetical protein [Candidatus Colivivens caballi]